MGILGNLRKVYKLSIKKLEGMIMRLINIGYGNVVSTDKLVAIVSPESAPIKRIVQDAKEKGNLIDATYGRKTRAVIITDSDHVILSSLQVETLSSRFNDNKDTEFKEEDIEIND